MNKNKLLFSFILWLVVEIILIAVSVIFPVYNLTGLAFILVLIPIIIVFFGGLWVLYKVWRRDPNGKHEIYAGIAFIIIIFLIIYSFNFLKEYSRGQERKEILKFLCKSESELNAPCTYNDFDKMWEYKVMPKTQAESDSSSFFSNQEIKYFTKKEECYKFCYKDWLAIDKNIFATKIFSDESIRIAQNNLPELQNTFWYKISNLLGNHSEDK